MKKIIALAAALMLLASAGCDSQKPAEETKKPAASADADGKVTQVIFSRPEEEDTTDQAIEYLKDYVPLYVRYLEKRRGIPLTYETSVNDGENELRAGIYIKDDTAMALTATDPDGYETRVVYINEKAYQISEKDKKMYYMDYPAKDIAKLISDYRIRINLSDVQECSYVDDYEELDGVMYKHEIIYDKDSRPSNYYYDEETGELRYIRIGSEVNKVITLTNEVTESVFELPEGYEMIDYMKYLEEQEEEKERQEAQ